MSEPAKRLSFTKSALIDAALVTLSMALAYIVRFKLLAHEDPFTGFINHVAIAALFSPVFVFFYSLLGVYARRTVRNTVKTVGRVVIGNSLAIMLLTDLVFFFRVVDFSRWLIFFFWLITSLLVGLKAIAMDRALERMQLRGEQQRTVLLVGSGPIARSYLERIAADTPSPCKVVGQVGPAPINDDLRYLGEYSWIGEALDLSDPDEIVVALEASEYDGLNEILPDCANSGARISLLPTYHEYLSNSPHFDHDAGLPLVSVNHIALDNMGYAFLKRAFDFVGAIVITVIASPIMAVAAIGTKLSSPGPVLFKQLRIGRNRQPFYMYKFRSMRVNDASDTAWTTSGDPRRTKWGSFMRRYSIDELPQLFNVIKGDMSLVGPRPEIPVFVNGFKASIPLYMVRHLVRPGMTGWAQINGLRGDTSIAKRIEYDRYYIEHWSFMFDLRILAETPFKGIVAQEETLV